ncbi:MAG: hypothetical protein ACKOCW_02625 [Planctomycetaceae bacterium]
MARLHVSAAASPRARLRGCVARFAGPVVVTALVLTAPAAALDAAEPLPAPADGAAAADAAAARRALEAAARGAPAGTPRPSPAAADAAGERLPRDLAIAKASAEVAARQIEARRLAANSPIEALELLDAITADVAARDLPAESREQLQRRIDRSRREIEEATGKRRGELEMERRSTQVEAQVQREREQRVEVDQRLAMLVEEYNALIDDRRYAEAEAIAKKAGQLAPTNPVVRQLLSQSRMIRRIDTQKSIEADKQAALLDVAEEAERASAPFVGPIEFPATKDWQDLTKNRVKREGEGKGRMTPAEQAIQRKLSTPVLASHRNEPLSAVLDALARQADVPIHLDMVGLEGEQVRSDTPVTIALDQKISLKSALKLLLEPLHLDYVIRDEVLKITSPRLLKGEMYSISYQVADLVIPVPSFSSDGLGITAALREGYSRVAAHEAPLVQTGPPPAGINAGAARGGSGSVDPQSLAQFQGPSAPPATGAPPSIPFGPPRVGGGQADFQSLIDLIQQTVAPQTWNTVGGQGAIQPFATNLSIVVSQTQEVHEEIADLLEQLRRLQDLQVTIEVRFISLADTFFERIGVDFDFNIQSNVREPLNMTALPTPSNSSTSPYSLGVIPSPGGPTQTIGLDTTGNPGVSLAPNPGFGQQNFFSIPFRQNSFGPGSVPALPGLPDPTTSAANFGFAILSDIEAYFLIQAAQGSTRSNVMQAPKVTLFNGQTATVSDTRQRPFVTSVVPVVGDFAAAQMPVITVLSEGTAVNVQAVVSSDQRFVRLTLVPFFSTIGKVEEFQFEGSRSTSSKSSDEKTGLDGEAGLEGVPPLGAALGVQAKSDREQTLRSSGTTIQLPEFLFTTVTTTVSVPDGGTVLLGGIKRQREGRNEYGVPILSKIPYINRLFKNVGLGRTTDSLMLMVTPRIIIQEEEEDKLLGTTRP